MGPILAMRMAPWFNLVIAQDMELQMVGCAGRNRPKVLNYQFVDLVLLDRQVGVGPVIFLETRPLFATSVSTRAEASMAERLDQQHPLGQLK
jgi:hypothetical protein